MIDALEDYHTCTVCSTTVHDFGPGADAVCDEDGVWMHRSCIEEEFDQWLLDEFARVPRTTETL